MVHPRWTRVGLAPEELITVAAQPHRVPVSVPDDQEGRVRRRKVDRYSHRVNASV